MDSRIEQILLSELDKVLEVPIGDIKKIENLNDYGMDSLGFALVINTIEDEFDIEFDSDELEFKNLKNFELIKGFVANKIMAKGGNNAFAPSP